MNIRRYWYLLLVVFTLLLPSCGNQGNSVDYDLVGRWEAYTDESQSRGVVMEFLGDGQVYAHLFNSQITRVYPAEHDQRRFIYSQKLDQVSFSGRFWDESEGRIPLVFTSDNYKVSFQSADEITVTVLGETQGMTFHRVVVPGMPFPARAVLGSYLAQEGCSLVEVEPLITAWQEAYPGYVQTDSAWSREIEAAGQWVATIQVEGDPDTRLLVIVEGLDNWTWILLEKQD